MSDYYEKISGEEYSDNVNKIIDIGEYVNKISNFLLNNNFLKDYESANNDCFSIKEQGKIKNGFFIIRHSSSYHFLFLIPDEWFIFDLGGQYFKCDQLDGLMKFLEELYGK